MMRKPLKWPWMARLSLKARSELMPLSELLSGSSRFEKPFSVRFAVLLAKTGRSGPMSSPMTAVSAAAAVSNSFAQTCSSSWMVGIAPTYAAFSVRKLDVTLLHAGWAEATAGANAITIAAIARPTSPTIPFFTGPSPSIFRARAQSDIYALICDIYQFRNRADRGVESSQRGEALQFRP
jgi:hypothetical protein